jgi:hypothetical protein
MNTQKKRILVYVLFIVSGFLGAYLFLRNEPGQSTNNTVVTIIKKDSIFDVSLLNEFFDFENSDDEFVSTEVFSSGKKSCQLSPAIEYGISITKIMKDIPSFQNLKNITVSFNSLLKKDDPDALYVLSIDDGSGKNIHWDGLPIVFKSKNEWSTSSVNFEIAPEFLNETNKISVYPWNRNKKDFFIDDVTFDYKGIAVFKNTEQSVATEKSNLYFDFETDTPVSGSENIKVTNAHSGARACDLSGGKEYGPSVNKKLSELGNPFPKKISMSAWIYPLSDNPNTVLTASVVNSKNETVYWEGKSTENKSFPKNKWTKINASYFLPVEKLSEEDILGVGVWNKGKTDVIIDDLEIVYGESPDRRGSASTIDAKAIYEKRFIGEKNKPPFQTIFFDKQEINNGDNFSITPKHKPNGTENFSPNDVFLVGDFFPDKYNLEEIICFKEKSRGMFSFSPESKQFNKLWENTVAADPLWNPNSNAYSGDFNTDGKTDVLLVETKTNTWKILNFTGKEWILVSEGKDPKKEWISNKKTVVAGVINPGDTLFPGNYTEQKQTYLKLNTDWRFDLKLLEKEDSGYLIIGNVDFKGYPKDYNPKYFEFVKLITGKFLSKEKTSVLVVMCNCADADFSGKKCDQIENLPFLPNSVQVYSISTQKNVTNADKNK